MNSPKTYTAFHGTNKEFDTFELSEQGAFGSGIYLTTVFETAKDYVEDFNDGLIYKVGVVINNPLVVTLSDVEHPLVEKLDFDTDAFPVLLELFGEREIEWICQNSNELGIRGFSGHIQKRATELGFNGLEINFARSGEIFDTWLVCYDSKQITIEQKLNYEGNIMSQPEKYTAKEMGDVANTAWQQVFPGQIVSFKAGALAHNDVYLMGYSASSKEQFTNGISNNDPMSLRIRVSNHPKGIEIEPLAASFMVNPENKHMAFGSAKIGLRKTIAKDLEELSEKLFDMFTKTKQVATELYRDGQFDVHQKRSPLAYQALQGMVEKPMAMRIKGQIIEADDSGFTLKTKEGNVEIPAEGHSFAVKDKVIVKLAGDKVLDTRQDRNHDKAIER